MILSDRTMREELARGRIRVEPLADDAVQPSSIDLRLGDRIRVFRNNHIPHIDLRQDTADLTEVVELTVGQPFYLRPGEFALGVTEELIAVPDDLVARLDGKSSLGRLGLLIHATAGLVDPGWEGRLTLETIAVPNDLVARLDGKSSLGRVGLLIHATAGLVDPGWEGRLTLELMNLAPFPITLFAGMKIGQISFEMMSTPVENPYGGGGLSSKYQGDTEPTPSRYHLELKNLGIPTPAT